MTKPKSLLQKLMDHVNSDWQWIGNKDASGYGRINTGASRKEAKYELAHRVSYQLFNGPIPPGKLVLHDCDDPSCVNPEHLHLGDHSMNAIEAHQRGLVTPALGEKVGSHKLTELQVREIRELLRQGQSQSAVSRKYGVSQTTIRAIFIGKIWGHLP